MFGDIQSRHARMNRLPPVTLRDYVKPAGYALVTLPLLYVFALAWYVVTPFILSII